MNIYAIQGHKVKVTEETKNWGYQFDAEQVAKHLEIEKEYTVDYTNVHSSSTNVFLLEFPGEGRMRPSFNSVNFVDVVEQSEEATKSHPDWQRYHGGKGRFNY